MPTDDVEFNCWKFVHESGASGIDRKGEWSPKTIIQVSIGSHRSCRDEQLQAPGISASESRYKVRSNVSIPGNIRPIGGYGYTGVLSGQIFM